MGRLLQSDGALYLKACLPISLNVIRREEKGCSMFLNTFCYEKSVIISSIFSFDWTRQAEITSMSADPAVFYSQRPLINQLS